MSTTPGTKNRVTGTQLGRIAMTLLKLNPTPIAWEETLDGLKQGLIDGAETWMGAAAYAIKAVRAAAPAGEGEAAGRRECQWQRDQLPDPIRALVFDDQARRNPICWSVFTEPGPLAAGPTHPSGGLQR